jgi:hypothetical protein
MGFRSNRRAAVFVLVAFALASSAIESGAATITLRSGNVPPPAQDPSITYLVEPQNACQVPFPNAFTPADFAAADAGPPAWSVLPSSAWTPQLVCDATPNWISIDQNRKQRSALYSMAFNVDVPEPCCIQYAQIYLCWMADDGLGDAAYGGPNPLGVYLNGVGLPIAGSGYTTEHGIIVDITSTIRCGENRLYFYQRDAGCGVAGVIFNATIDYNLCVTPSERTSWGRVRATYR